MSHPYRDFPDHAFWGRTVGRTEWSELMPVQEPGFRIGSGARIGLAGSCFAQNLSRWLPRIGLAPFFTEVRHPLMDEQTARAYGYGQFSARYGNIYTARQLRQLVEQALGYREPIEEFAHQDGRVWDLLRPRLWPGGYVSEAECRADRLYHLDCVRRLLLEAHVMVFTLGLNEAWMNRDNQVVYPACPGTVVGEFDPARHAPVLHEYESVTTDLQWIVEAVRAVNPGLRWILTVSPVHMIATFTRQHVAVASMESKSVLRAAAGWAARHLPGVSYFPSYELIALPQSGGQYIRLDRREVTEAGVAHVMRVFAATYAVDGLVPAAPPDTAGQPDPLAPYEAAWAAIARECEETFNDPLRGEEPAAR